MPVPGATVHAHTEHTRTAHWGLDTYALAGAQVRHTGTPVCQHPLELEPTGQAERRLFQGRTTWLAAFLLGWAPVASLPLVATRRLFCYSPGTRRVPSPPPLLSAHGMKGRAASGQPFRSCPGASPVSMGRTHSDLLVCTAMERQGFV